MNGGQAGRASAVKTKSYPACDPGKGAPQAYPSPLYPSLGRERGPRKGIPKGEALRRRVWDAAPPNAHIAACRKLIFPPLQKFPLTKRARLCIINN